MSSDDRPLKEEEQWWASHHDWLASSGYQLRPRYTPGWVPSWKGSKKRWYDAEDGIRPQNSYSIMDAIRKEDGAFVTMKRFRCDIHPFEKDVAEFFSRDELASDPKNHCVKVIEFLQVPDGNPDSKIIIIVMPLLRDIDDPMFETVGELMGCLQQLFEGLQFMHKHHVAHRDCNRRNAMMDASSMYIDPWHPVYPDKRRDNFTKDARHHSRTQRPPKYYWIDFGLSRQFDASETNPLADPIIGGDKSVPEFREITGPVNPFPTDVYYLGNLVKQEYLELIASYKGTEGLEFLHSLIYDMVHEDPSQRPTMDEALKRFEELRSDLTTSQLRSVLQFTTPGRRKYFRDMVSHWLQRLWYILLQLPAVPSTD
ncbi:hypothetical protein CONPUDRAFT_116467 [Coniophora puteana RWD-64-598 SS2]|uniref:Protein kinase domain-containing protein n=1 Tax=Coniophora puteana (strain RWD-64-598) TaxID=741705 RepID=A0A5M3N759_CONPW|nr:uncharacterized protein CONPUDRAFT_116467 [Coniophora puteana RWD-64-598 SS2]EIW87279.1 hypothetical protein CONPUDRAFT_116467 [Coniophora puteana RWD-64-598 SS2]